MQQHVCCLGYVSFVLVTCSLLSLVLYSYVLKKNGNLFVKRNIRRVSSYSIIVPFVLYGCETWSITLTEKRSLRVSENMVLRRLTGPQRDKVTGMRRKIHNEELNDMYSSQNIIWTNNSRRIR